MKHNWATDVVNESVFIWLDRVIDRNIRIHGAPPMRIALTAEQLMEFVVSVRKPNSKGRWRYAGTEIVQCNKQERWA